MTEADITKLVPQFILHDKNGYALAKALEAGINDWLKIVQNGIDCVLDVEKMPEWRLDEMAWELGCLYDYSADVERKRAWIRDAVPLYAKYGTVEAIYKFLEGYFDTIEVEEWWQYAGEPYHFRVTVSGEWTNENEIWARKVISRLKNVRSELDDLSPGSGTTVYVKGDTWYIKFPYEMDSSEAGTTPVEAYVGRVSDSEITESGTGQAYKFPYTMAGTTPQEAWVAATSEGSIKASPEAKGYKFPYEAASTDAYAGETPEINTIGVLADGAVEAAGEAQGYKFPYEAASTDAYAGETPEINTIGVLADGAVDAAGEAQGYKFPYEAAGTDENGENTGFAQSAGTATTASEGVATVFQYSPASGNALCGEDEDCL